jgi:hypothetical protein
VGVTFRRRCAAERQRTRIGAISLRYFRYRPRQSQAEAFRLTSATDTGTPAYLNHQRRQCSRDAVGLGMECAEPPREGRHKLLLLRARVPHLTQRLRHAGLERINEAPLQLLLLACRCGDLGFGQPLQNRFQLADANP